MGPGSPTRQAVGRPGEPRSWSKEDDGLTPLGLAAVTQAQVRGDWQWRDSMLTGPPRSSATLLPLSVSVFYSSPLPHTQRWFSKSETKVKMGCGTTPPLPFGGGRGLGYAGQTLPGATASYQPLPVGAPRGPGRTGTMEALGGALVWLQQAMVPSGWEPGGEKGAH